jgi:hypothetical protein
MVSTGTSRLAAAAATACALLLSLAADSPARPLDTGVVDVEAFNGDTRAFARTKAAGSRFVRLTLPWRVVAPQSEPLIWDAGNPADHNYDWSSFDRQIRGAVAAGLVPVAQIETVPAWAQGCRREQAPYAPCDPDPRDVAAFARAAAHRYDGGFLGLPRVRYWMLFNEPNTDFYFNPQFRDGKPVSPLLYRRLINAFAPAIDSADRSNVIVGPGLTPVEFKRFSIGPLEFMRRLLCMRGHRHPRPTRRCGGKTTFDVWAHNPYTTGGPTHEAAGRDEVSLGDLPEMARLLRAAERAGRIRTDLRRVPFWVTEFAWDSKPPDPGGLAWRIHARWVAEAMYRAWRAGVSAFFWFGLRDPAPSREPPHTTVESGLYLRGETFAGDRPKRVLHAFRFPFVAFRGARGIRVWGRTPTSSAGPVRIEVRKGRRWRRIAVLRADRNGIFGKVVRTRFGRGKRGLVRARYRKRVALPFSLRYIGDFYAPPFGLAPGQSHVPQRSLTAAAYRLRTQW